MVNVTIRISENLKKDLETLAKAEKRTLSNLIRYILEKGVKPNEIRND